MFKLCKYLLATTPSSFNSQSVEGTVDADANYQLSLSLRAAETEDMIEDMPPLKIELVSVDDVQYINFDSISEMYADAFPDLVEGWQTTEDLLATFEDDTAQQLIIQNLTNITLPSEGPLTDNLIESVIELESEEIDDIEMRVFEIELDALQVLMMQSTGTLEQMRELLESTDFILKSEYTLTYTLWIGAEDGLLYQGESEGYTYLPYLTEEQDGPPYDITIEYSSAFTISDHGTVETITLPAEME